MEAITTSRSRRFASYEKLITIGLAIICILSPLYIDRKPVADPELDEEPFISLGSWLPLLLVLLIFAIALSFYVDRSFTRFDPYWIHRVGGSSGGIVMILVILALVLKCKGSLLYLED